MPTRSVRVDGEARRRRPSLDAIDPGAVHVEGTGLRDALHAECERLRRELELERRRGAEERARLSREIEEAVIRRDEFLSAAAHDLKAPLSVLQLSIQTLLYSAARGHTENFA